MPELYRVSLSGKQLQRLVLLLEEDIQTNEDIELLTVLNVPLRTVKIDSKFLNFNCPFMLTCKKEDYVLLLEVLFEEKGCMWADGDKFTQRSSYWDDYGEDTCYYIDNRSITFSRSSFYLDSYEFKNCPVYNIEDLLI